MAKITLNTGVPVRVSPQDHDWARQFRWTESTKRPGRRGYAMREEVRNGKRVGVYLHRAIAVRAGILRSLDDPRLIDHIDRNHFNCMRSNLRVADHSLNNQNVATKAKSGHRGVYRTQSGKWSAEIQRGGVRQRKVFDDLAEAVTWREGMTR